MATMRPAIQGTRHVVSTGHYYASQAAFQILEDGGNAIDAGVCAGIALGVLQSDLVSVGGVAPIIVYIAETQEVVTISGLGWWPRKADVDYFHREHGGAIPGGVMRTTRGSRCLLQSRGLSRSRWKTSRGSIALSFSIGLILGCISRRLTGTQ